MTEEKDKKHYVYIDTGRFRELENAFKKATANAIEIPAKEIKLPPSENRPYMIAVVITIVMSLVIFLFVLSWRPDIDILIVGAVELGFSTTIITLLINTMITQETKREAREAKQQAQETHLSVNGRMDAFMKNVEAVAMAKGREEGQQIANERTDNLAKQKE